MKTFAKAQLSAFLGGIVDYLVMLFFTEIVGIFSTYSIVIGGIIGAIINFSLNRMWTFNATDTKKRVQLPKFVLMVAGSILVLRLRCLRVVFIVWALVGRRWQPVRWHGCHGATGGPEQAMPPRGDFGSPHRQTLHGREETLTPATAAGWQKPGHFADPPAPVSPAREAP